MMKLIKKNSVKKLKRKKKERNFFFFNVCINIIK